MATRTVATATVRAVKRKLLPTRQALTLVKTTTNILYKVYNLQFSFTFPYCELQTPAAVGRVKELLKDKSDYVSDLVCLHAIDVVKAPSELTHTCRLD